ncbi:MAG: hypothetical protein JWP32_1991 [Schumannella sp.]|nr:hypothetical protein [Schumannella sp.]
MTTVVRSGELRRPRIGWYSTLAAGDPRFRAVAAGGRLTGASALHVMGAWMLDPPDRLHVAVAPGARVVRSSVDACIHWVHSTGDSPCVVSLVDALTQAALSEPLETVVSVFDWALHTGRLHRIDFERILLSLPAPARVLGKWVDPDSESVLESIARVRLRRRGWGVRSQVRVGELGAIDLVIEDHIALELDGREHHEKSFERDRRKDLQIVTEGRQAIRVTYSMLTRDWQGVERAIEAALAARRFGDVGGSGVKSAEPRGSRRTRRPHRDNSASVDIGQRE